MRNRELLRRVDALAARCRRLERLASDLVVYLGGDQTFYSWVNSFVGLQEKKEWSLPDKSLAALLQEYLGLEVRVTPEKTELVKTKKAKK